MYENLLTNVNINAMFYKVKLNAQQLLIQ